MTIDYKNTVFLPKTDFPMRAGLAQKEPEILKLWEELKVYETITNRDSERFVLHEGPPYANGSIHIGHAMGRTLRDITNRFQAMMGKKIISIPGFDCHGLPIEWKIEEKYREKKLDKDQIPVLQFREECREFARHWIGVQTAEFKRLGVMGDWEHRYLTMDNESEARIAAEIHKFLLNGKLYRGERAVMWSTVEKTALADAEVEYHDHTSDTIWVAFPVVQSSLPEIIGAHLVIWTTTPWTMPANRAIAYGPEFEYVVYEIIETGKKIIVATALAETVKSDLKISDWKKLSTFKGEKLSGTLAAHPLRGQGYDYDVRVLPAEFVTTESGTGLVHIAPSHGLDDFLLGREHGLEVPYTVEPDGRYVDTLPLFGGARVYNDQGKKGDANKRVIAALEESGALLAKGTLQHSYPHSWRSKAPLIFRTTPQWFIRMDDADGGGLRQQALAEIEKVKWIPAGGKNRIRSMVEGRPDWCISRQRAWGVPIAIFVNKQTREPLRDETVCKNIVDIFAREGSDAWFARPASDFLGAKYNAADYEQIFDIVDVWFESGSTHAFVCEARGIQTPVDLYLEGSDQHRGWFQSSLLESVGTRGHAPYKAVFTHGYVLDEQGRKMSKSLGNVVAPQKIIEQAGADILRLWACNTDYSQDIRIGNDIIKQQSDLYRRLRNTLRYLLGALADFDPAVKIEYSKLPPLEQWVLHRMSEINTEIQTALADFDYNKLFSALHEFCNADLSAFYFDIRKDSLYCDAKSDAKRQAALWVMNQVFLCLTAWLAPILAFTCEEAWQQYAHRDVPSVHLRTYPKIPAEWRNDALASEWKIIRNIRSTITISLEKKREDKSIGSSLQASVKLSVGKSEDKNLLDKIDFAEVCIVSQMETKHDPLPGVSEATRITWMDTTCLPNEIKCERCWRYLPDVGEDKSHPTLCARCAGVVNSQEKLAA